MVTTTVRSPKTLAEAIRYYSDPDVCLTTMVEARWPKGVTCPTCGAGNPRFIATRRLWECRTKHPRRQFSAKVGTIFEDSPLKLETWFPAVWLIANAKNGISSHELGRALGVTQKTAWFMLHRIRLAMKTGTFLKLSGQVEAAETFIGPNPKTMHRDRLEARRKAKGIEDGSVSKAIVAGLLERGPKGKSRAPPRPGRTDRAGRAPCPAGRRARPARRRDHHRLAPLLLAGAGRLHSFRDRCTLRATSTPTASRISGAC